MRGFRKSGYPFLVLVFFFVFLFFFFWGGGGGGEAGGGIPFKRILFYLGNKRDTPVLGNTHVQNYLYTVNPRKSGHGLRMSRAGTPFSIPFGHGGQDVPTF